MRWRGRTSRGEGLEKRRWGSRGEAWGLGERWGLEKRRWGAGVRREVGGCRRGLGLAALPRWGAVREGLGLAALQSCGLVYCLRDHRHDTQPLFTPHSD